MVVKIEGKEYEFSFDSVWGPLYTYEEIAGKRLPFDPRKMLCLHVLFYSILLKANEDFTLSLDDFMKALNDIQLVNSMSEYYNVRMAVLTAGEDEASELNESENDSKKKD